MRWLLPGGRSIRQKLITIVLATTFLALAIAGAILVVLELRSYQRSFEADLATQADIVGTASVAALAFDDPKAAGENLGLLRASPTVSAAAVYRADGSLFATFARDGAARTPFPPQPQGAGARFEADGLALYRPILSEGERIGTVYLLGKDETPERVRSYLGVLGIVIAISLLSALLVTNRLQASLTRPVTAIADVARRVMEQRDYSLRAARTTDDEVGLLVDAFNDMLTELGRREAALHEANQRKDEFIATLAHELRNPLAPIRTGLQILAAAPAGSDSAARAREIIERQLNHMVRLVDDLLDISRITSAKVKLDKAHITVQQAVTASIEASAPFIEAAGQELSVSMPEEPIPIFADLTRMAQALGNILNNAAKYTPRGGRITLEARREGDEAVIRIADNGAGIPPEMLDRVFDMFTQVGATMGDAQGGLGIGLSIVRRLIGLHQGTVQASSEGPGRGSAFTIRLPCDRHLPPPDAAAPAPAVPATPHSLDVLVVDDNIDAARTMVMLLEMSGHRARMAHNGPDALAASRADPPDAILLDIGLPGMSGYEVAREMRADRALDRTRLIALTGWGSEADKRKAMDAGFDAHLTKPVGPDVVLDLLDDVARSGAGGPGAA